MAAAIWVQLSAPNPLYARVASSHSVLTSVPPTAESRKSLASRQAFLSGASPLFRAFKSEYSNVEAVRANGRSTNAYKAAFTV
jgi:hypothetical protein